MSVADFYAGKCVFITGSTGFLGKVLLEKILYSCPEIEKIYILLRGKKGLGISERLQQILELPIFTRLKRDRPKDLEKIYPVAGNIDEDGLGLSKEDHQLLIDEVSCVFHSAATTRFTEPLDVTLNTNVKGTERILTLCRLMKKLHVLVHVSTAYSNIHKIFIEEKFYPPPIPIYRVDEIIKEKPDQKEAKLLIGDRPNAYAFSKSLGEAVIAQTHGNVPVVVVRPSIVCASLAEPIPGWLDTWGGATGIIVPACKGLARVVPGRGSNVLDLIPVDYVINLMIVAATRNVSPRDVLIYNCATSTENPLTLNKLSKTVIPDGKKHKFNELPIPSLMFIESKLVLNITAAVLQTCPAILADAFLRMAGKEPKYKKLISRIEQVINILEFYTRHSWKFSTIQSFLLASSLSQSDREKFEFSPSTIDWTKYLLIYSAGIRKYMFKNKS